MARTIAIAVLTGTIRFLGSVVLILEECVYHSSGIRARMPSRPWRSAPEGSGTIIKDS